MPMVDVCNCLGMPVVIILAFQMKCDAFGRDATIAALKTLVKINAKDADSEESAGESLEAAHVGLIFVCSSMAYFRQLGAVDGLLWLQRL